MKVSDLICILSITVYGKEKVSERYFLADRNSETLSKDMVIIAKYDVESNEDLNLGIKKATIAFAVMPYARKQGRS